MANLKLIRSQNQPSSFYVDSTCINCGTCYWVAPETYKEIDNQSAVVEREPQDLKAAYRALFSCPTNSIGRKDKDPIMNSILDEFPYQLEDEVYHTGFHAENSFGAASYFIKRTEGNILIDSPRFVPRLSDKFKEMGGLKLQLLTHKDDVADTDAYWNEFNSQRMIHKEDANSKTSHYEHFFSGQEEIKLSNDLIVIPVEGHTKGSVCYLYKNKYLFTGDHLAYSPELGHLIAFKNACWYDFSKQIVSMERLLKYEFEYVLPGHDFPFRATKEDMKESLELCIGWMKQI